MERKEDYYFFIINSGCLKTDKHDIPSVFNGFKFGQDKEIRKIHF